MNQLHPGARWLFRVQAYLSMIFLSIFLVWFMVYAISIFITFLIDKSFSPNKNIFLNIILLASFVYILLILIIGEIYARMSYNRWFYEFDNNGLRLERGIIWKRYSNIPYERIQNVDIHRGIIARIFGFSSLIIQTAGYSGYSYAEGYIPALETSNAEKIRSFVMKKVTKKRK